MYEPIQIRKTLIAPGIPRICVPLTGKDEASLLTQAVHAMEHQPDLVEWRADCFEQLYSYDKLEKTSKELRKVLGDCPVIFTCRTEDGGIQMDKQAYIDVNRHMIYAGTIDLVDAEIMQGEPVCRELVEYAHAHHVFVIMSNHEFTKTPDVDVMLSRLQQMYYLGADILKLAVMPRKNQDVLKLLQATNTYREYYGERPLITMSMGSMGSITRVCGELFGSAVTFAAVDQTSAPGQLSIDDVRKVLEVLHYE